MDNMSPERRTPALDYMEQHAQSQRDDRRRNYQESILMKKAGADKEGENEHKDKKNVDEFQLMRNSARDDARKKLKDDFRGGSDNYTSYQLQENYMMD